MNTRLPLLSLGLVLATAGALPADKPAEWVEAHSAHFHVISNGKPKDAEEATQKLEEFRHLLGAMFSRLRLDPPAPARVVIFKNSKSFSPYAPVTTQGKPEKLGGFMQPGPERMYLAVDWSSPEARQTLFHEYVHLVVELNFKNPPVWLNEGLAEFYERTEIEGADFRLGEFQPGWWDLLQREKMIPLATLVQMDYHSQPFRGEQQRALFYAESWLLVHYCVVSDEGKRAPQFGRFVQLFLQGLDQESAFAQAFGTDFHGMERQLQDYLQRRSVLYFYGKMPQRAERVPLAFTPLDSAVAQAYLADLWLNRGELSKAEQALQPLVAAGPAPAEVRERLGRLALLQGRAEESEQHFEAVLQVRPTDIGLRYYTALAISRGRLASRTGAERRRAAAEMVELLTPVIAVEGGFPDAYSLLVQARLARDDPPSEMIPFLEQARKVMPQRHDFDLLLASLYLRERRWEEAETLLQQVARQASSDTERRQAEEWLEQVRAERARPAGEPQGPVLIEQSPAERVLAPSREPEEPPPAAVPSPAQVKYIRGTLVTVACSDDSALLTIKEEAKKGGEGKVIFLAVRSRSRVILIDPTESGRKLDCGPSGAPVGINYRVQPDGPNIAGVVMSVEFYPPRQ